MEYPLVFSKEDYISRKIDYPDYFTLNSTIDHSFEAFFEERHKNFYNNFGNALFELKKRTTSEYYLGIEKAQTEAREYSKKACPPLLYFAPETIADDWLSMQDWHKKYGTRDHSIHQTLTAYIVQKMLGFGVSGDSLDLPNGKKLLDYCAEIMCDNKNDKLKWLREYYPQDELIADKHKWAKDVFYEACVISALFHDIGYPWQFVYRLSTHLNQTGMEHIFNTCADGQKMKEAIKKNLLRVPFYNYDLKSTTTQEEEEEIEAKMKKTFEDTHGVPGAVCFIKLNEASRREFDLQNLKDASCRLILEWASVGIMMHDMEGKKLNVDFETDPLSCIIAIADVLEEFSRPSVEFSKQKDGENEFVRLNYCDDCLSTSIEFKNKNELHIVNLYAKDKDVQYRTKEINKYFNDVDKFIDLTSCGIDKVVFEKEIRQNN